MYCNNCGSELKGGLRTCAECGMPVLYVEEPEPEHKPRKKVGKAVLLVVLSALLVAALAFGGWVGFNLWQDTKAYEEAAALLEQKEYDEALRIFKQLGDFEDATQQVRKLEKCQKDYDAALQLLKEEQFTDAQTAFEALKDYRDSKSYGLYAQALAACSAAKTPEDYVAAAEIFASLEGFERSPELLSDCYLAAAHLAVLGGDPIEDYLKMMDDEDLEAFNAAYHDAQVLDGLEKALQIRYDLEQADAAMDYSQELAQLEPLVELECIDLSLKDLVRQYYEAVAQQQDMKDNVDMLQFYELELKRSRILTQLYESNAFLKDNIQLQEYYVGREAHFAFCVDVQTSLAAWHKDLDLLQEDGEYFLVYTNDTQHSFLLKLELSFYDEDGNLLEEKQINLPLTPGMAIKSAVDCPEDMESWKAAFTFDVYEGPESETT